MNEVYCPYCGAETLPGDDECSHCCASLHDVEKMRAREAQFFISADRIRDLELLVPPSVPPDATVRQALDALRGQPEGSLMVVQGERLVGIVTERDFLYKVALRNLDLDHTPVSVIMTLDPVRVQTNDRVAVAFNRLSLGGFRHLPVTDKTGKVAGQVMMKTLIRYLRERLARYSPAPATEESRA